MTSNAVCVDVPGARRAELPPVGDPEAPAAPPADGGASTVEAHPDGPLAALHRTREYQELARCREVMDQLLHGEQLYRIDEGYGSLIARGDRTISLLDIKCAAADPQASPELRALAQQIVDHPGVWAALDPDGNGVVSEASLRDSLGKVQARLAALEDGALRGGPAPGGSSVPPGDGTSSAAPFLPAGTGRDAVASALGHVSEQLHDLDTRLAEAAAASPPDQALIQHLTTQRQELMLARQTLMQALQQEFEMLSNELKVLGAMSQTAINNLR